MGSKRFFLGALFPPSLISAHDLPNDLVFVGPTVKLGSMANFWRKRRVHVGSCGTTEAASSKNYQSTTSRCLVRASIEKSVEAFSTRLEGCGRVCAFTFLLRNMVSDESLFSQRQIRERVFQY